MIENGLGKSVFPMSDLSVMGLSEIVTSLPLLRVSVVWFARMGEG